MGGDLPWPGRMPLPDGAGLQRIDGRAPSHTVHGTGGRRFRPRFLCSPRRKSLTCSLFVRTVDSPGLGGQAVFDIVYQTMRTGARCCGKAKPKGRTCAACAGRSEPCREKMDPALGHPLTSFTWGRYSLFRKRVSVADLCSLGPRSPRRALLQWTAPLRPAGHGVHRSFSVGSGRHRADDWSHGRPYAACLGLNCEFRCPTLPGSNGRGMSGSETAAIATWRRSARVHDEVITRDSRIERCGSASAGT